MSYRANLRKLIITPASAPTTGNNILIAGGQFGTAIGSIRVYQVLIEASAGCTIIPYSNTTQIAGEMILAAGQTLTLPNEETPWQETLPGQSLVWNLSAGGTITGSIWYALA